jgi:hypothetical protein
MGDRQTDRQTPAEFGKDFKTRHWKSAIFDNDDTSVSSNGNWDKLSHPLDGVTVYVCDEICPKTNRPHKQVHVDCGRQQRLTYLTKWISATKWIPVIGKEHVNNSIDYCQEKSKKAKGTIAGSSTVISGEKFYTFEKIMMCLASKVKHLPSLEDIERYIELNPGMEFNKDKYLRSYDIYKSWDYVSSMLIDDDTKWVNKLSNPAIKVAWEQWGHIFIRKFNEGGIASRSESNSTGSLIIEEPGEGEPRNEVEGSESPSY